MTSHYQDESVTLHHGDCLDILRELPDASVDAVVTDPPYGLANTDPAHVAETITRWVNGERDYLPGGSGFMGKEWDAFVPPAAVWDECLRVLKPGGHVLTFAGSRTVDLMTLGLRLAGFDIRDSIAWLYGSGFPKSLDVSKAIDKAAGAEREVTGRTVTPFRVDNAATRGTSLQGSVNGDFSKQTEDGYRYTEHTAPATPDAEQWQGWGTALKPAFEPVVVARKPLAGTVAANVLEHGTGALNIAACRVEGKFTSGWSKSGSKASENDSMSGPNYARDPKPDNPAGRWPTNVVLDDTQAAVLDEQSGELPGGVTVRRNLPDEGSEQARNGIYGSRTRGPSEDFTYGDSGGASRFFPTFRYEAKAPQSERPKVNGTAHPTVKPLDLMRWLVRLVTPPGGTVLEPFAGSGTTVEACVVEGFRCVAIEKTDEYLPLITQRINRQRDPVAYMHAAGDDLGLFDFGTETA